MLLVITLINTIIVNMSDVSPSKAILKESTTSESDFLKFALTLFEPVGGGQNCPKNYF